MQDEAPVRFDWGPLGVDRFCEGPSKRNQRENLQIRRPPYFDKPTLDYIQVILRVTHMAAHMLRNGSLPVGKGRQPDS